MAIAALVTWLITAAGGFIMLGTWISQGGHRADGRTGLPPGLVFGHFGLAVVGLVVWIVYLFAEAGALAWLAFVLLLPVALLGFAMFVRWLTSRRAATAESRFPIVVVFGHGLFAVATVLLVLLTALGVNA